MNNVHYEVKAGKLVITVDLSEKAVTSAPPSKTGNTRLVGSTGGAIPLGQHHGRSVSFALNVMAK